ncbi:M24 family metallopeptidase [Saccharopolyspora phatthalungensis]|uniref:Xaa-Pro dipeptidase n=1 Tax=Saccharopolyspora phatthalungensis TaxID=664693 RepID=A0A840QEA0_9PSEU|nr:Xaa-Pro peptidase family protein [Saccharopolyspora phatthalungensis]MBB5158301.1 Xaa-Pro dipeptidase [Saccharopolyspora phatthalungensis]
MPPIFTAEEYHARVSTLRKALREHELDAAVVHTPENVCYLSGHATPGYYTYQCLVVTAAGDVAVLSRETETVNAGETTHLEHIVGYPDTADPVQATVDLLAEMAPNARAVGVEARSWFFPPALFAQLTGKLEATGARIVHVDDTLAGQRLIKSAAEIEQIRAAAASTNAGMAAAARAAVPGASEREVAAAAFSGLIKTGSEYFGMEPFVASGPRAGTIHASWSDRVIGANEPVLLEMSATVGRYNAPLMHTVWTGELSGQAAAMAGACADARAATLAEVRPGGSPAAAHQICKEVIAEAALAHTYRKRSGYSVGIAFAPDWGEGHILSLKETEERTFEPGMVVHVVPTLRISGVAGIGLSATVLVTEDGHEVLTSCQIGPQL